jgi:hypothetical protein
MKPLIAFLSSRWGIGALAVAFVLLVWLSWPSSSGNQRQAGLPSSTNLTTLTQTNRGPGSIPNPLPPRIVLSNAPARPVILSLDAELPPDTNSIPTLFAPAGCSLKCVLVNSLESIRIDTPVIGLVIEDLVFRDQLVVPRNTKVIGKAQVDRVRDRLAADGTWTLVFPNGEEMIVPGTALHCDESPDGRNHGPHDGSAGFRGVVIRSASWDELKLFASSFLSAMARSQQQSQYTIYGPQVRQSLQTSASAGTAAVLDDYARSIAESIKRDGIYVHVDGGSLFYLFLPQTLDRTLARIGATRHSK